MTGIAAFLQVFLWPFSELVTQLGSSFLSLPARGMWQHDWAVSPTGVCSWLVLPLGSLPALPPLVAGWEMATTRTSCRPSAEDRTVPASTGLLTPQLQWETEIIFVFSDHCARGSCYSSLACLKPKPSRNGFSETFWKRTNRTDGLTRGVKKKEAQR